MEKTWMPTAAGILSIIAGGLSLLGMVIVGIVAGIASNSPFWYNYGGPDFPIVVFWVFFFIPYFIVSAVAIAGVVFALRRSLWGLALAGAICALLTGWAWWLGVAAIVLVAISKREFDRILLVPPSPPVAPPPPPSAPVNP
jgi:hypothetical protein